MQTILGAGGAIGTELAKALRSFDDHIRLVSRNPRKVNESDELFAADLMQRSQVFSAVEGSSVVYLTAGFKYDTRVWQRTWPEVMRNVIDACMKHHAKLVFFDNMYLYDKDHMDHITEDTPVNPPSGKGRVRAQLEKMLFSEVHSGRLTALIARAPDFLGLHNSVIGEMVLKNLHQGKKAMWFADVTKKRNMTFPRDAARATALLGNTADAWNQVWHVPSTREALTGREWIERFASEMGVKPRVTVVKPFMLGLLGIFIPIMKEFREMMYQYDRDYFFDSSKFEKRFAFQLIPLDEIIKEVAGQLKSHPAP
jgi:nucleoside-diphosphate-sugar epimerase